MWNPFRNKPLLSEEDERFQIETYRWLLTHFGGDTFYRDIRLILPTKDFFPSEIDSVENGVQYLFKQVKFYMGLQEWPCKLVEQEEDPNMVVAPTVVVQNVEQNPLGTFSVSDNKEVVITYNPNLTSNPTHMAATFAHELAHYLTSTAPVPPPGGWDNWEFATDIAATFLGFGVFQANAVFNFQQYTGIDSQGWKTTGGGYLSEAEHSYSLAIFLLLKNIPVENVYPHCDANIKVYLRKALQELADKPYIDELRDVEYVQQTA